MSVIVFMARSLLILFVFVCFGLVSNVAQSDIFLRKTEKKEETKKEEKKSVTSIFLRPFAKKEKHVASKNYYKSRLNTEGLRKQIVRDMRLLAYWQQVGRKPQGLNEMRSYAIALRSPTLNAMLLERSNITPKLERMHAENMAAVEADYLARAPNAEILLELEEQINAANPANAGVNRAVEAVYTQYKGQDVREDSIPVEYQAEPRGAVRKKAYGLPTIFRKKNDVANEQSDSSKTGVYKRY